MVSFYAYPNILFHAIDGKNLQLIKECLKNGYNINQQNTTFETLLIRATKQNKLSFVQTLVENGADLNLTNIEGKTALQKATNNSSVQKYLKTKVAKSSTTEIVAQPDMWGFSHLMWAIFTTNQTDIQRCLALGANVNENGKNGTTPLIVAAFRGKIEIVLELLSRGACVNQSDNNGNTALTHCFSMIFHFDIANLLIDSGADVNGSGEGNAPPLIAAAFSKHNSRGLKYLLERKANVNLTDRTGNTALGYASYFGSFDNVKILIENQADLDLCGEKGKTPLSWAATANNWRMVKFLLENGAKIGHKDYHGCTALSYAKLYGHGKIIEYLEKRM